MKKLLFILMLCPLMMITSCKDNAEKGNNGNNATDTTNPVTKEMLLAQEIKASNELFPMQVEEGTTLLSLIKDGNHVIYEYSVDEDIMDFKPFIENKEGIKNNIKNQIITMNTPNSEAHAFMSLVRDTGKDLRYQYTGNKSGKVAIFEFTNDDLHEMITDFDEN